MADRVMVMEEGKVTAFGHHRLGAVPLDRGAYPLFWGFGPLFYAECEARGPCPVTVREGRLWLDELLSAGIREREPAPAASDPPGTWKTPPLLPSGDKVWFRYEKTGPISCGI